MADRGVPAPTATPAARNGPEYGNGVRTCLTEPAHLSPESVSSAYHTRVLHRRQSLATEQLELPVPRTTPGAYYGSAEMCHPTTVLGFMFIRISLRLVRSFRSTHKTLRS